MEPDDKIVEIEAAAAPKKSTRWKASADIEDLALSTLAPLVPIQLQASEKRFEEFYQHGYLLYQSGHYNEAKKYFFVLSIGDPKNAKYLFAVAATAHMLKEYGFAITMYSTAAIMDTENPLPLYHCADCFIRA